MKKFEYKTVQAAMNDSQLNTFGQSGWELISHTAAATNWQFGQYYVFKKEIL